MSEEGHGEIGRSRSPSVGKRYGEEIVYKAEPVNNAELSDRTHRSPEDRRGEQSTYSSEASHTLYVTNIAPDSRTDNLRQHFSRFGEIQECRVIKNPVTKESRGFAFITYRSEKDADDAHRAINGKEIDGRVLRIEKAKRNRPHEPTPGQYMGPTGASVKYDQRGRLRPGFMPYYALPPPRGAELMGEERREERGYKASRRSLERGGGGHYSSRYERAMEYERRERYDRRPLYDRSDRYMYDGHYLPPEEAYDYRYARVEPRDAYGGRGPPIGGPWGYPEERRGRVSGVAVEYRERARSRSRDRYPAQRRERRSFSPPPPARGRYGAPRERPSHRSTDRPSVRDLDF
eukprot:Selendium_serpulae@DN4213_c0_g1_i2.p1